MIVSLSESLKFKRRATHTRTHKRRRKVSLAHSMTLRTITIFEEEARTRKSSLACLYNCPSRGRGRGARRRETCYLRDSVSLFDVHDKLLTLLTNRLSPRATRRRITGQNGRAAISHSTETIGMPLLFRKRVKSLSRSHSSVSLVFQRGT